VVVGQGDQADHSRQGAEEQETRSPDRVGPHYAARWKVERLFSWLGNFRRLLVRQDRSSYIFRTFVLVAFIVICLRQF
jgi:IS4 transposase